MFRCRPKERVGLAAHLKLLWLPNWSSNASVKERINGKSSSSIAFSLAFYITVYLYSVNYIIPDCVICQNAQGSTQEEKKQTDNLLPTLHLRGCARIAASLPHRFLLLFCVAIVQFEGATG